MYIYFKNQKSSFEYIYPLDCFFREEVAYLNLLDLNQDPWIALACVDNIFYFILSKNGSNEGNN